MPRIAPQKSCMRNPPPPRLTTTRIAANPPDAAPKNAVTDLLPYCTTETPLSEAQIIALSDLASSLKDVMLLAMQAKTDERVAANLVRAVGPEAAGGIVEFFTDEYEL